MIAEIIKTDGRAIVLDLSEGATLYGERVAGRSVSDLSTLINRAMFAAGTDFAFGRYAEPRELYGNENFASAETQESRTIHMGIDLFCVPGTPICAPLDATVQYVANNDGDLDYGPLVILRHHGDAGHDYFSLYGHLGIEVLDRLASGKGIAAGEQFATVGTPPTNGNWPPHLHFQLITDLLNLGVDFPGVALKSQQEYWLGLSPSPAAFFPEMDAALLEFN